ncbi:MAG TPA: DUF1289 domain-containing protein [Ramlibacter sp.]|nr:DUF1289 domain-containing protein [Ramlibacter sp.]
MRARTVGDQARAGAEPPSPCISVCRMDAASGLCEGCMRTLEEIAGWGTMAVDQRVSIWAAIEQRARAALTPALSQRE